MKPRYLGASILSLAGLIFVVLLSVLPPIEGDSIRQPPIQVSKILEPDPILDIQLLLSEINTPLEPIKASQGLTQGPLVTQTTQTTPTTWKLTQIVQKPLQVIPVCRLQHRSCKHWIRQRFTFRILP